MTLLRISVFTLAVPVFLVGCGGGSNDNATSRQTPDTGFISIGGNANGHVLTDGKDQEFARTTFSSNLYAIAVDRYLNGLTVDDAADIKSDGQKVGQIVLDKAADARSVAYLVCSGPAPNFGRMTISVNATGYSYSCASNTGSLIAPPSNSIVSGTTPIGTSSRTPVAVPILTGTTIPTIPTIPTTSTTPTAPADRLTFDAVAENITSGLFNLFRVTVKSTANIKMLCITNASYQYTQGGTLVNDSNARTVTLNPETSGFVDFGFTDRNIGSFSFRVNCTKSAF